MAIATRAEADRAAPPLIDAALAPLFAEVAELKRVRSAQSDGRSLADLGFRRAWAALIGGADPAEVAATELAFAAAHVALGPVDAAALAEAGVPVADRRTIYRRAAERALGALDDATTAALDRIAAELPAPRKVPRFVDLLSAQPRAGAVSADAPRLVLSPEEMHSEHCWATAVIAGLVQRSCDEDPAPAFLTGLAHHLHNAYLPDGGFAAEVLLDDHLAAIFATLTERALAECPQSLAATIRDLLARKDDIGSVNGRAFNIADVVDRVLQQRHYANVAGFSLSDAMDTRELVHPGPLQAFQFSVLSHLGLAF